MKLIIAGGRNFEDYDLLATEVDDFLFDNFSGPTLEVVSGGAVGADSLGEEWALDSGIPVKRFPADWAKHGKAAGPIRNQQMAKYADALIAFWDGKSRGTKNMIDLATKAGLLVKVVRT